MNKEVLNKIINHYGSQRKLARALCVTDSAISQWITAGWIPPAQAIRIERAMAGSIRAVEIVNPD